MGTCFTAHVCVCVHYGVHLYSLGLHTARRSLARSYGELPEVNVRVQSGLKAVSMPTQLLQTGLMETAGL